VRRTTRRALLAGLFAVLTALLPAAAAQPGAPPDINTPFLVNPDVERWKKNLENEGREVYAKRNEILAATGVKPGMVVADVGAGTGLFTLMFAEAVKPGGRVYAVDISQAFIESIRQSAKAQGLDNVTAIVTNGTETNLPDASVDVVYISDTYHHFERPEQTLRSIRKALRAGGRMVVIDFERVPGVTPQQRIHHVRADKHTAIREIEAAGFRFVEEKKLMRENYFVVFQRP
jgi:ubiquinone/menaquinone biosynthesis C-methylase UbiE